MTRIFDPQHFTIGEEASLQGSVYQHVIKVLRKTIDDKLVVFNGLGGEYFAHITAINKQQFTLLINDFHDENRESPLKLTLVQSLVSHEKMAWIIQKAVELGVQRIVPVLTERSTCRLPTDRMNKRLAHWEKISVSACEQCGYNKLPVILPPQPLTHWLNHSEKQVGCFLHPQATHTLNVLKPLHTQQSLTYIIGPEGGFTEKEITDMQEQGFIAVSLGKRIMRVETATISVASILQYTLGDLS